MNLSYSLLLVILLIGVIFIGGCVQQNTTHSVTGSEPITTESYCGDGVCDSEESYSLCQQDCNKLVEIKRIAEEYHNTHTYTLNDFFVCSDMVMEVWNLLKTQGIDAKLCAGNVEENSSKLTGLDYFVNINHAWVLAEAEPFTYIAVETTGGYLVWNSNAITNQEAVKNDFYYDSRYCFDTPKQLKSFIEIRTNLLTTCQDAASMETYWNDNYVGKYLTPEISEYKGRMNQKEEECTNLLNELKGLLT